MKRPVWLIEMRLPTCPPCACRRYKRPVWLTEFACPSNAGTASKRAQANEDYFAAAAKWMDSKDWIER